MTVFIICPHARRAENAGKKHGAPHAFLLRPLARSIAQDKQRPDGWMEFSPRAIFLSSPDCLSAATCANESFFGAAARNISETRGLFALSHLECVRISIQIQEYSTDRPYAKAFASAHKFSLSVRTSDLCINAVCTYSRSEGTMNEQADADGRTDGRRVRDELDPPSFPSSQVCPPSLHFMQI